MQHVPPHNEYVFLLDVTAGPYVIKNALDKIKTFKCLDGKCPGTDRARIVLMNYPAPQGFKLCNPTSMPLTDHGLLEQVDKYFEKLRHQVPVLCDWITAMEFSVNLFWHMVVDRSISSKILIVVSNFKPITKLDPQRCISLILNMGVKLIAVVNTKYLYYDNMPVPILNIKHIPLAMSTIYPSNNPFLNMIGKIATSGKGIVTTPMMLIHLMLLFESRCTNEEWSTDLTVGGYSFKTLTSMVFKSAEEKRKKPFLKPMYKRRQAEESVVPDEEVATKRYYFGQEIILPPELNKQRPSNTPSTIKILGFIDPVQLHELYYGGTGAMAVRADKQDARGEHFLHFVKTLNALNKWAIATPCVSKDELSKLYVMNPQKGWLLMQPISEGANKVVQPTVARRREEDSSIAPEWQLLRKHLLAIGMRSPLQPQASPRIDRIMKMDIVRKNYGHYRHFYRKEELFQTNVGTSDIQEVVDKLFDNYKA